MQASGPNCETIYDVIATDLGQQYFLEHLRREFSEEQLICVLVRLTHASSHACAFRPGIDSSLCRDVLCCD